MGLDKLSSKKSFLLKWRHYRPSSSFKRVLWFLAFVAHFLLAIYMGVRLSSILTGTGTSARKFTNNYCLNAYDPKIHQYGNVPGGNFSSPCGFEYNFNKTLYFWLDGISWDTAGPIFEMFNTSNTFKIKHKEWAWSAWIFATLMTGKPNRNMGQIPNDNLFHQFNEAGMTVELAVEETTAYVGHGLSEFVCDREPGMKWHKGVANDDDTKPGQMFNWFFGCQDFKENSVERCVNNTLDSLAAKERSMFFESFYLDHQVHYGAFNKYTPQIRAVIMKYLENMIAVKKWIDSHPDYLLILVSDHGQKATDAESAVHGSFEKDGNEGFILFYNPQIDIVISTAEKPEVLRTIDVLPTTWQFFAGSGISIPAENVGIPRVISNNPRVQLDMLKANAHQLMRYAKQSKIVKPNEEAFHHAMAAEKEVSRMRAIAEMAMFNYNLSDDIKAHYQNARAGLPCLIAIIAIISSILLQFTTKKAQVVGAVRYIGVGFITSAYFAWFFIIFLVENPTSLPSQVDSYSFIVSLFVFIAAYISRHLPSKPKKVVEVLPSFTLGTEMDTTVDSDFNDDDAPMLPEKKDTEANEGSENNNNNNINDFVTLRIWDSLCQFNFKKAILTLVNYIIGSYKKKEEAPETWLVYFIAAFTSLASTLLAYNNKKFLVTDIFRLNTHPGVAQVVMYLVLYLEFRFQRIQLTSKLQIPGKNIESLRVQLFHPSFWGLNLKMVAYFIIFGICYYSADLTYTTGFLLYSVLIAHIGILFLLSSHLQRDLALPTFALLFLVQSPMERIVTSLYFLTMNFISHSLEKRLYGRQHALPSIIMAMLIITHFYFAVLGKSIYGLNEVTVSMPGIADPTLYPIFSVAIMGIHYFGLFLLLVPFLVRLTNTTPALRPIKFKSFSFGHMVDTDVDKHNPNKRIKRLTSSFLLFLASSATTFFYYFLQMRSSSDSCAIWAGTAVIISLLYALTLIGSELPALLYKLARYFVKEIVLLRKK